MAVVIFDASALVKMHLREGGSEDAKALWAASSALGASRLAWVEVHSAFAGAQRSGRITAAQGRRAVAEFRDDWEDLEVFELDHERSSLGADLVAAYALSGADAVHLATALSVASRAATILATWDRRLHAAALDCGLSVPVL